MHSLQGACNEPKPWGWSVVNNAKWQSWKQLGDMAQVEAMRLYVRTLEEEVVSAACQAGCGMPRLPAWRPLDLSPAGKGLWLGFRCRLPCSLLLRVLLKG